MIGFAPAPLYRPAVQLIARLRAAGHEAYIAGGAVRDYLLGRPQCDLDIATSARPDQVRALFRRTFAVGEAFGVVIVHHQGQAFEVATFREEEGYLDGRRPSRVSYSTARADVARRDFTINGMLWDPEREEILDWVEGRLDIQRRLVRTIGDPEARFGEDRLRMLRALRFSAQLDFDLDAATLAAIQRQAVHLPVVSLERVRLELEKLFAAPAARRGLVLLEPSGLGPVLRDLLRTDARRLAGKRAVQLGSGADWAWLESWSGVRDPLSDSLGFQGLLCLLLDVAGFGRDGWQPDQAPQLQAGLDALGRALRFSRVELAAARSVAWLCAWLPEFSRLRLADQLRWLRRPERGWLLPVLRQPRLWPDLPLELMTRLIERHQAHWQPAPLLRGEELQAHGLSGPALGRVLDELEALQLEGALATPDEARRWLATHDGV
ncbi:MAG: hypothetical protein WC326_05095 [Candidatus Delongbacteria bacterium]